MENQFISLKELSIVIIPSPLVLGRTYQPLVNELSKKFKTHIIELPGSGGKSGRGKKWNEKDYAQWMIHQLEKRNIKNPILLGHSNSGNTVLKVAAIKPEAVRALILADTTGTKSQSYTKVLVGRIIDSFIEWKFSTYAIFHFFYNLLFHPSNFIYQIQLAVKTDLSDEIKNIKVPTLIAWGEKDQTIPIEIGKEIQKRIPHAVFTKSAAGSHDWCITHPTEFLDAVVQFAGPLK